MNSSSILAGLLFLAAACHAPAAAPNSLSAAERADGWRLLFDGRTTAGWRTYKEREPLPGWQVEDGALVMTGGGGDLVTRQSFGSFELRLEWRIAAGGNSGIFYHVTDTGRAVWESGPEMQVLDDERHPDGRDPKTSAGACYALYAPARRATRPVGEWNRVRLVVDGPRVEHWLNGELLCTYELGSEDWRARVAASKFAAYPSFGVAGEGHIALQDHGDRVEYRSIAIRPLD